MGPCHLRRDQTTQHCSLPHLFACCLFGNLSTLERRRPQASIRCCDGKGSNHNRLCPVLYFRQKEVVSFTTLKVTPEGPWTLALVLLPSLKHPAYSALTLLPYITRTSVAGFLFAASAAPFCVTLTRYRKRLSAGARQRPAHSNKKAPALGEAPRA